jgi:hypothetical protein
MKYINLLKKVVDRSPGRRQIDISLDQDRSASVPGEGQMYDHLDIMRW